MTYTFKISIDDWANEIDVTPLWDNALTIDYKKENEEIFYRKMLKGNLVFTGVDYQTIYAYDNDDEVKIKIYQDGVEFWEGFFGKFDGEWDEDACTFTVEPTVYDDYTCLKHEWEEEYNILNSANPEDVIVDFAYLEYVTSTEETVALQTTSGTRYGYLEAAGAYTFPVGTSNRPWGGCINPDVYCLDNSDVAIGGCNNIWMDYSNPYGKNINATAALPQGANPALTKDRGYIVYETTIHSADAGFTDGGDGSTNNYEKDFVISTTWFREIIWTVSLNGIDATRPSLTDSDGWGNTATDYVDQVIIDGVIMHKWARIPDNIAHGSLAYNPTNNGNSTWPKTFVFQTGLLTDHTETVENCRPIKDVVEFLLTQIGCGLTYKSTFFNNDALPVEAAPEVEAVITAASGDNYVTEEANKLNYLMIAQKSDIISCVQEDFTGCYASQNASVGMISLKDLSDALYNMFQVYPYIDSDGYFRYEHERFFNKELGTIDLTTQLNRYNRELWEKNSAKYKYTFDELFGVESWDFMEQNSIDFMGEAITYDSILSNTRIKQNVKKYIVPMVTTDIIYIYEVERPVPTLSGNISTDGFVIMQCSESGGVYTCDNEVGAFSGDNIANNHLSVANLQDNYWRWNRIQEEGNLNGDAVTFNSTSTPKGSYRRIKEQMELQFNTCTDTFDDTKLIKTSLGNGEIYTANYNLSNGIMTVTLRYLP